MRTFAISRHTRLTLDRGDLTRAAVDAVVNAANQRMLGGGGVDGAIHRAAGPDLLEACRRIPEVRPGVRCPTGDARITGGFRLPARYVIHTVGPVYHSAGRSAPALEAAYQSALRLANAHLLASIAFPAISCGVYGYPLDEAAAVSLRAVVQHADRLSEVRFVLFDEAAHGAWLEAAEALRLPATSGPAIGPP